MRDGREQWSADAWRAFESDHEAEIQLGTELKEATFHGYPLGSELVQRLERDSGTRLHRGKAGSNGERMYVESCNIRDLSDTSSCMVGHPDRPTRNGIMVYTNETRGALKALLPTCTQPSAKELAAAEAMKKKRQDIIDANTPKTNPQPNPAPARPIAQPIPPKNAEERAMRRFFRFCSRCRMQQITEISKMLGGMPATALVAVVIIAGFGLAAYAISAVVTVSKGKRSGD